MEYVITWNDGRRDRYDIRLWSFQELLALVREITMITHGAYTARIDLEEMSA